MVVKGGSKAPARVWSRAWTAHRVPKLGRAPTAHRAPTVHEPLTVHKAPTMGRAPTVAHKEAGPAQREAGILWALPTVMQWEVGHAQRVPSTTLRAGGHAQSVEDPVKKAQSRVQRAPPTTTATAATAMAVPTAAVAVAAAAAARGTVTWVATMTRLGAMPRKTAIQRMLLWQEGHRLCCSLKRRWMCYAGAGTAMLSAHQKAWTAGCTRRQLRWRCWLVICTSLTLRGVSLSSTTCCHCHQQAHPDSFLRMLDKKKDSSC
mmetsp:Transcript_13126/g.35085  ORF Transcript_13126/g.35085 Transcript_13126/m.35085 type:complete len:261 (-) Transcript_13126:51-833(-)